MRTTLLPAAAALGAILLLQLLAVPLLEAQDVGDADCGRRLNRLIGRWHVVSTTFGEVTNPPPLFVAQATADGRAVHSVFTQQVGATHYEAVALWACSAQHQQVRVFEVNTTGFVEMYVGAFDQVGILHAELRDNQGVIQQRRTLEWVAPDTLVMSGSSRADGKDELKVTMVRLP